MSKLKYADKLLRQLGILPKKNAKRKKSYTIVPEGMHSFFHIQPEISKIPRRKRVPKGYLKDLGIKAAVSAGIGSSAGNAEKKRREEIERKRKIKIRKR